MECKNCKRTHMSDEFPVSLTENCTHFNSFCFVCSIDLIERNFSLLKEEKEKEKEKGKGKSEKEKEKEKEIKCIEPSCVQKISIKDLNVIKSSFPYPYLIQIEKKEEKPKSNLNQKNEKIKVIITTLDGSEKEIQTETHTTINKFKEIVKKEFKVEPKKQKLIFKNEVLYSFKNQIELVLENYSISNNSKISLLIMMYEESNQEPSSTTSSTSSTTSNGKSNNLNSHNPESLHFNLSWGFPNGKTDYLDGTCFLCFSTNPSDNKVEYDYVNYSKRFDDNSSTQHSGDILNGLRGEHLITVNLKTLSPLFTRLFFTLSAYNAQTISAYESPKVKLTDEKGRELSSYSFESKETDQALIMCCLVKSMKDKRWTVYQVGRLSKGNVRNYEPLKDTIQTLIQNFKDT